MRFRRSQQVTNSETNEDDVEQLLEQVRKHLPEISETRQNLKHQLDELHTQLDQLDGIAQRLALLGLISEGARVLEHQTSLSEQRLLLTQQHEEVLTIETRLRSAEHQILHRLEYGEDEPGREPARESVPMARVREGAADHGLILKPIESHE